MRIAHLAFAIASTGALLLACGSEDGLSKFQDPNAPPGIDGNGNGGTSGGTGIGGSSGGTGSSGGPKACATATALGENLPVQLVIQYDRSGSMDSNGKWAACKAGITDFFATSATGVSASLSFFPQGNACDTGTFTTPQVPMTALPNTTTLKAALDATTPGGGTPTRPALDGAMTYAAAQQAKNPNTKVVVVLVTDGDPNDCSSNVASVSAIASAKAKTIPTYVIGVGNITALNAIAIAGGTKSAVIVDGTNPTKTKTDMQKALDDIRNSLTCELKIPTPPNGQTFDKNKVNVVHTQDSVRTEYTYDQTCAKPNAWRYDNPTTPTKIEICPATCDALKKVQAKSSKIDIEFGCETNGSIPK